MILVMFSPTQAPQALKTLIRLIIFQYLETFEIKLLKKQTYEMFSVSQISILSPRRNLAEGL